jgi:hypothetical protein
MSYGAARPRLRRVPVRLQASVWEHRVADWIQRQDPRSSLHGVTPRQLRVSFGLAQFRSTYQALSLLGGWPTGLWWAESAAQPRGILGRVDHQDAKFELAYVEAGIDATQQWPHRRAFATVSFARWARAASFFPRV